MFQRQLDELSTYRNPVLLLLKSKGPFESEQSLPDSPVKAGTHILGFALSIVYAP